MGSFEEALDILLRREAEILRADDHKPHSCARHCGDILGENRRKHAQIGDTIEAIEEDNRLSLERTIDLAHCI